MIDKRGCLCRTLLAFMKTPCIFISSPGDVQEEHEKAKPATLINSSV